MLVQSQVAIKEYLFVNKLITFFIARISLVQSGYKMVDVGRAGGETFPSHRSQELQIVTS